MPDIRQTCCAEKRINNGMYQHVRIGMPGKTEFMTDFFTAEKKVSPLYEWMCIKAIANSIAVHRDYISNTSDKELNLRTFRTLGLTFLMVRFLSFFF